MIKGKTGFGNCGFELMKTKNLKTNFLYLLQFGNNKIQNSL
jgi:hypothetical protein